LYRGIGATINYTAPENVFFERGNKQYEFTNHLGNVLATISDKKKGYDTTGDGQVDYFLADVRQVTDYHPFGMQMHNRSFTYNLQGYKYGFNGKENDKEVAWIDFGARMYDSRLGRFFKADPKEGQFPWQSTYAYASNNPIRLIDVNGESTGDPGPSQKYIYDALKVDLKNMPASHRLANGDIRTTAVRLNGIRDNSPWYWDMVRKNNPSIKWSKSNAYAIDNGFSPRADKTFIDQFPEFEGFKGQTLEMHHMNQQNGTGIALPEELHRGKGFTKLWHKGAKALTFLGTMLTLYQQTYGKDPLLVGQFTEASLMEDEAMISEYGLGQNDYNKVSQFAAANNSRTGQMRQGTVGIYYASEQEVANFQFFNLSKAPPGTFIVGTWGAYYPNVTAASQALNKKVTYAIIFFQQNGSSQGFLPVNAIQLAKPSGEGKPRGSTLSNTKLD
jgi:RHS repeat-associated protein